MMLYDKSMSQFFIYFLGLQNQLFLYFLPFSFLPNLPANLRNKPSKFCAFVVDGNTTCFFFKKTTFLKFFGIWQNVSVKFPDQMLSVNLEYFIIKNKMQNSITI